MPGCVDARAATCACPNEPQQNPPVVMGAGSARSTVLSNTRLNGIDTMKATSFHISERLRD
jgi:hypothetical protein